MRQRDRRAMHSGRMLVTTRQHRTWMIEASGILGIWTNEWTSCPLEQMNFGWVEASVSCFCPPCLVDLLHCCEILEMTSKLFISLVTCRFLEEPQKSQPKSIVWTPHMASTVLIWDITLSNQLWKYSTCYACMCVKDRCCISQKLGTAPGRMFAWAWKW